MKELASVEKTEGKILNNNVRSKVGTRSCQLRLSLVKQCCKSNCEALYITNLLTMQTEQRKLKRVSETDNQWLQFIKGRSSS